MSVLLSPTEASDVNAFTARGSNAFELRAAIASELAAALTAFPDGSLLAVELAGGGAGGPWIATLLVAEGDTGQVPLATAELSFFELPAAGDLGAVLTDLIQVLPDDPPIAFIATANAQAGPSVGVLVARGTGGGAVAALRGFVPFATDEFDFTVGNPLLIGAAFADIGVNPFVLPSTFNDARAIVPYAGTVDSLIARNLIASAAPITSIDYELILNGVASGLAVSVASGDAGLNTSPPGPPIPVAPGDTLEIQATAIGGTGASPENIRVTALTSWTP